MEDKLKENSSSNKFNYPDQYEMLSVETAFSYLDLARDGHGSLFKPDNYYGFKALLVLKCGIDIDYVFGNSFKENIDEVKKHKVNSNLSFEELEKEVEKRIAEEIKQEERQKSVNEAIERYNKLNIIKKALLSISKKDPSDDYLKDKSVDEINKLFETPSKKR